MEPTVKEYITITRINHESGNERGGIELMGRFIIDLSNNAFSGTNGEDTVKHVEKFLKIADSLNVLQPLEESNLKDEALRYKAALEESMNQEEESSNDDWSHYSPIDEWEDYEHDNDDKDVQNEMELNKDEDDDMEYLDDYLVHGNAPFIINEQEERFKERRCKLLGIPFTKPLSYKTERFELVQYSFGPSKKYVAIKECGYYDWTIIKETTCHAYQDIFHKMDEGWFVKKAE
ncbi:hypothetical protein Tco_1556355 [Tanacetum coccineum]